MKIIKATLGLIGFFVFLVFSVLIVALEVIFLYIPWLFLKLTVKKYSTRYIWIYGKKSFRIANYCYDWSEFPD